MSENSTSQLMKFFADPRNPGPTVSEFREFWESLSEDDKAYYKSADLG